MSNRLLLPRRKLLIGAASAGLLLPVKALAFPPFVSPVLGRGVGVPISASYTAVNGNGTSWAAQDIGAAASDRIVVVGVNSPGGYTGCTIAGNAATLISNGGAAKLFALAVPTGATATIAITGGAGGLNGIVVWAMYGLSSTTAYATGTGTTSASCNVLNGGIILASGFRNYGGGPSAVWGGGVTSDVTNTFSAGYDTCGAHYFATSSTSVSATLQAGVTIAIAMAAWGP